jgi:hypothetical protein
MMKRLLAVLLSLIMLICLLPACVWATELEEPAPTEERFTDASPRVIHTS